MGWRKKEDAKLANVKLLVVGAGGIGCELLKNLALTGFKSIHVIDLDTIDVSNLNRQFLFRREHVGLPKSQVASATVKSFAPSLNIKFTHGSIFGDEFNLSFFESFDMVLNALDNRAARNHVNRMCIAGRVPLIESGSAGYLGQVSVIIRDRTECYECVDKPATQKTFPGCTIRNTPSEHIHCTVWSKHLFNQLFGEIDIDDDVSPDLNDKENKDVDEEQPVENGTHGKENGAANGEENGMDTSEGTNGNGKAATENGENSEKEQPSNTRVWAEQVDYDSQKVFDKLFYDDIVYLCSMKNLWKERKQPIPVKFADLETEGGSEQRSIAEIFDDVNKVWSRSDCARVFASCVEALKIRKAALPEGEIMSWDKDDDDAMRFVAACANIRATIFGIQAKTLFDIKAMAGNIIPAIATTNAIVAGMMVTEALKVVHGDLDRLRNVFIGGVPNPRGKILSDEEQKKPNPRCYVCSDKRECIVKVNVDEMTVKGLCEKVLKGNLNMLAPDVTEVKMSRVIISSEEGELEDLFHKKLAELSISDGTILECDDFKQNLELKVIIQASEELSGEEFEILRDSGGAANGEEESRKRKVEVSNEDEAAIKKAKVNKFQLTETANGIAVAAE